jgi:hypothetical protein
MSSPPPAPRCVLPVPCFWPDIAFPVVWYGGMVVWGCGVSNSVCIACVVLPGSYVGVTRGISTPPPAVCVCVGIRAAYTYVCQCLLAVLLGAHPDYPVVVVHNREEDSARPTKPPALPRRAPAGASAAVLAGIDMEMVCHACVRVAAGSLPYGAPSPPPPPHAHTPPPRPAPRSFAKYCAGFLHRSWAAEEVS